MDWTTGFWRYFMISRRLLAALSTVALLGVAAPSFAQEAAPPAPPAGPEAAAPEGAGPAATEAGKTEESKGAAAHKGKHKGHKGGKHHGGKHHGKKKSAAPASDSSSDSAQ
ncbi:hypothetical protein AA11825_1023 [Acetobacter pomorum DSM 11825]|nr:hypothetical protein AA11825_1023 [Acetobacter pomorum DSM 11825]